ncbi:MAG: methyltransferase domain-containing protein [Candidatus Andersenbacteria bacterium]
MQTGSASSFIRPEEFWRDVGLRAEQTVAHLGCGAGFYLIPAAMIVGPKGKVIGVDILPDMLAEADGRARRAGLEKIIRTVRSDLESAGSTLPAAFADWVLVANILHQADPQKMLTEARRIVHSEGAVVVVDWDTLATPLGPPPKQRISRDRVLEVAATCDLKVKSFFTPSPYHYGILLTPI